MDLRTGFVLFEVPGRSATLPVLPVFSPAIGDLNLEQSVEKEPGEDSNLNSLKDLWISFISPSKSFAFLLLPLPLLSLGDKHELLFTRCCKPWAVLLFEFFWM